MGHIALLPARAGDWGRHMGHGTEMLAGRALVQAVTGITDDNGNLSINWPVEFAGTPVVSLALQTSIAEMHSARITAVSSGGASVHVMRAPLALPLGTIVTAAMANAAGVVVHAVAVGAP